MAKFSLNKALQAAAQRNAENPPEAPPSPKMDPNSPGERIKRAREHEFAIRGQILWLTEQPDSELKTQRLVRAFDRLGELLAEQGLYEEAATISVTEERRKHYARVKKAIEAPDEKTCKCPDDLNVDRKGKQEFRSPAMMHSETIVMPDGSKRDLRVCRKCGYMNAVRA